MNSGEPNAGGGSGRNWSPDSRKYVLAWPQSAPTGGELLNQIPGPTGTVTVPGVKKLSACARATTCSAMARPIATPAAAFAFLSPGQAAELRKLSSRSSSALAWPGYRKLSATTEAPAMAARTDGCTFPALPTSAATAALYCATLTIA